jgi:hypothetical protein
VETVSTAARTPGRVTVDSRGVRGEDGRVSWDDLRTVRIRDGADFVLRSRDGRCVVPVWRAPDGFLERLQELPGFDNGALVSALARPRDVEHVCWRA